MRRGVRDSRALTINSRGLRRSVPERAGACRACRRLAAPADRATVSRGTCHRPPCPSTRAATMCSRPRPRPRDVPAAQVRRASDLRSHVAPRTGRHAVRGAEPSGDLGGEHAAIQPLICGLAGPGFGGGPGVRVGRRPSPAFRCLTSGVRMGRLSYSSGFRRRWLRSCPRRARSRTVPRDQRSDDLHVAATRPDRPRCAARPDDGREGRVVGGRTRIAELETESKAARRTVERLTEDGYVAGPTGVEEAGQSSWWRRRGSTRAATGRTRW